MTSVMAPHPWHSLWQLLQETIGQLIMTEGEGSASFNLCYKTDLKKITHKWVKETLDQNLNEYLVEVLS